MGTTTDDRARLNGPAFPLNEKSCDGGHYQTHLGMTLRDYFASRVTVSYSAALDSLDSKRLPLPRKGYDRREITAEQARLAYVYADAMLEARTK